MKSLHIRNLDDEILSGLKRRAVRHRRSLQKEIECLLEDAARMSPPEEQVDVQPKFELNTVATGHASKSWNREDIYGNDGR